MHTHVSVLIIQSRKLSAFRDESHKDKISCWTTLNNKYKKAFNEFDEPETFDLLDKFLDKINLHRPFKLKKKKIKPERDDFFPCKYRFYVLEFLEPHARSNKTLIK